MEIFRRQSLFNMYERTEDEQPRQGISFEAFVNTLEELDELEADVPLFILEAEETALRQEARKNFFDNMNA